MLILLLALLLGTAGRADAEAGRFLPYGPPRGALLDLVVGPAGRLFLGAEESGVYASRDGGRTWAWSGAGTGNQAVRAQAADPASGALYAVGDSRVFISKDGGESWQTLASDLPFGPPPEGGGDVLALGGEASPTLYLARGVRLFRGTAGGAAWKEVLDTPTRIRALLVDPQNPLSVFAGPEEAVPFYPLATLWHSADGGSTWSPLPPDAFEPLQGQPPPAGYGVRQLLAAPGALFVVLANAADFLYRSVDGGATWRRTPVPAGSDGVVGSVVLAPAPLTSPLSPDVLYADLVKTEGSGTELFASTDLGTTWERRDRGEGPPGALRVDPASGGLYALSSYGVARAEGGGARWSQFLVDGGCENPSERAGGKLRFPRQSTSRVYALANSHLYVSDDGGVSWRGWTVVLPDPSRCALLGDLAIDPRRDETLYLTSSRGLFRSTDAGASWESLPEDAEGGVAVLANGTILAGDCGLRRSTDDGKTWSQSLGCDVDLGGPEPGSRLVERLLVDPLRPLVVYAEILEAGGHPYQEVRSVHRSANGGRTWRTLPVDAGVIALDPRHPGTLYTLGPSGVSKSVDDGRRFRKVGDLPLTDDGDLLVDPVDSRLLWAARPDGVWQSRDGGATWQARSAGLRGRPAFTLFADPRHRLLEVDSEGFFSTSSP